VVITRTKEIAGRVVSHGWNSARRSRNQLQGRRTTTEGTEITEKRQNEFPCCFLCVLLLRLSIYHLQYVTL
jgi:hypothetical protein